MPSPRLPVPGRLFTWVAFLALLLTAAPSARTQTPPRFESAQVRTNGGVTLRIAGEAGRRYRLEFAERLSEWTALSTFAGAASVQQIDSARPESGTRFYRVRDLGDPAAITGDHVATADGEVLIHPVNHASVVLLWNGRAIYVDPVGGAAPYAGLPRADLILVTHSHSDHYDNATLALVRQTGAPIVAPAAVWSSLTTALKAGAISLANGGTTNVLGVPIEAIPAYNANHPKGTGNGYVLNLGGRRIYFSGDTSDAPEIRALTGIDIAFLCMNSPYTFTVSQAATTTRAFRPHVVYPYHFRNADGTYADLEAFARLVGTDLGIEVRARKWY